MSWADALPNVVVIGLPSLCCRASALAWMDDWTLPASGDPAVGLSEVLATVQHVLQRNPGASPDQYVRASLGYILLFLILGEQ